MGSKKQPKLGGYRYCLKCAARFYSENRVTNRLCLKCNQQNLEVYAPRIVKVRTEGEDHLPPPPRLTDL